MKKTLILFLLIFTTISIYSQINYTYSGEFRSIKGVMDGLSCYCYNAGYLTYDDDMVVEICFDDDDEVSNGYITVTGYYENITHESQPIDPCPTGMKNVLIVTSYQVANNEDDFSFEKEWVGKWATEYGDLHITVSDNKLTGNYPTGDISGDLIKTDLGSEIRGEWIQADGKGWFSFYKYDNEDEFFGEWGYAGVVSPAEGEWSGKRNQIVIEK